MSDEKYREWIRTQPSCLSGRFSEFVHGEGRNLACHIRRAATSGTGYKAPFSCVPMTDEEHRYQHQHGELAALLMFGDQHGIWAKGEFAKEWFDDRAAEYREEWFLMNPNDREEWKREQA